MSKKSTKACLRTCLHADILEGIDSYGTDPLVAARIVATQWNETKEEMIDCWNLDFFTNDFLTEFLLQCSRLGILKEAKKIHWCYHIPPMMGDEIVKGVDDLIKNFIRTEKDILDEIDL